MQTEPQNNVSFLKSLFESGENSEGFQQKIADFFPAIIYVYDPGQKKLRFVNKKLTDLLGYSYEDLENSDNDFMKFVFKDDVLLVEKELDTFNSLEDNITHSYNSRFTHKEGNWKYFRTQGTVLRRNENGSPASLLLVAQDITEQMQSEEEARASRDMLNETEMLLRFGTWTWDIETDKVVWSNGLYALFGYPEENIPIPALSNSDFIRHVKKDEATDVETIIKNAVISKKDFEKVFSIETNDNKEKIVFTRGKVITSSAGDVTKLIGVTHDITDETLLSREQKRLKDNLSEYRETMIEKERRLDFGSLEMNLLTGELYWSDGMYLLFGYDPVLDKSGISLNDDFYRLHMTQADIDDAREKLRDALKDKENYIIETPIQTKRGAEKRLETYGKIERLPDGKPSRIVGISRDITRLKDYEKNLQQKIEELNRSNKELEEFAYIASHDLQEPLRKITAFSERLQEKVGDELSQEAKLYLQRILAATQNMRLLIDNLLEFSRTNRHSDSLETIDLNNILKEIITDLELKIEETNARVQYSSLPSIISYHSQMKQLFTNLLSNAIKFRKPDQPPLIIISSEVASEKEKANFRFPIDKRYFKIVVRDSGIGFEKEYALKIFQIFQRLHGKAEYPGSGIGLAICKKIVENHHGVIYAESGPGEGAVFTVIIPETQ